MDPARRTIPIVAAPDAAMDACAGAEPFALMVLGDSMAPEFVEGDVIVVEPGGLASDGAYVLAQVAGEWVFRKLVAHGTAWRLVALDGRSAPIELDGLERVRGVVIQKSRPGDRRATKLYGP